MRELNLKISILKKVKIDVHLNMHNNSQFNNIFYTISIYEKNLVLKFFSVIFHLYLNQKNLGSINQLFIITLLRDAKFAEQWCHWTCFRLSLFGWGILLCSYT